MTSSTDPAGRWPRSRPQATQGRRAGSVRARCLHRVLRPRRPSSRSPATQAVDGRSSAGASSLATLVVALGRSHRRTAHDRHSESGPRVRPGGDLGDARALQRRRRAPRSGASRSTPDGDHWVGEVAQRHGVRTRRRRRRRALRLRRRCSSTRRRPRCCFPPGHDRRAASGRARITELRSIAGRPGDARGRRPGHRRRSGRAPVVYEAHVRGMTRRRRGSTQPARPAR